MDLGPQSPIHTMSQLQTIWNHRPLVANFAQRELKSRYRRSLLGWTWSLINPLSTILIYTLVFSTIFRAAPPPMGNGTENFALYLFSGIVSWNLFATMVTGPMDWLAGVADLLRKIRFPPDAAIFGGASSGAVQTLIESAVLLAVMAVVGNSATQMILLPYVLFTTMMFGLGIGFVLSIANAHFRDVRHLVAVVLNMLFFLCPIVYPPSLVPEEKWGVPLLDIVSLNPMYQYIAATRDSTYLGEWSSWLRLVSIGVVAVVTFAAGWSYFVKASVDISEEL